MQICAAVLFAHGKHFTVGLQLDEVREWILQQGKITYPEGPARSIWLNSKREPNH